MDINEKKQARASFFVRLHAKPKICRGSDNMSWTVKQNYYFNKSLGRYLLTDDGIRTAEMEYHAKRATEIGSITQIRMV